MAEYLRDFGYHVTEFYDDTSTTQQQNLDTIINFHNSQDRDLDVSVHFNAYLDDGETTNEPKGTEVWYKTQEDLAARVSAAIGKAGHLYDRGGKQTNSLAFLNGTDEPAILIEVCFIDSTVDVAEYQENFDAICRAIASVGVRVPDDQSFHGVGKCSWFGGPEDTGVTPSEGLAFIYSYDQAPWLFLSKQPPGTTGLARRLDPEVFYVACRWDYEDTPKTMLDDGDKKALVRSKRTGEERLAWPADWGPHGDTNRIADLSPGLMSALGIETDDEVEVVYPAPQPRR